MEPSKLSDHIFKKGTFTTPLNSIPCMQEIEDERSWIYGRMPEYLWIGLILNQYGRQQGLSKLYEIITELHSLAPEMLSPRISDVLSLDSTTQEKFYMQITKTVSKETLSPLTIIFTCSRYPEFSKCFFSAQLSIQYILLLEDNLCKIPFVSEIRYKMCIAHLIYSMFEKEKFGHMDFSRYITLVNSMQFDKKIFESLYESNITESTFKFYDAVLVVEECLNELYKLAV